ncbi:MAG: UPF0182 family protein [Thermoanaerobacteraceae bacterium]|nr:UPF0182 family protein [Thermoanaerobacteraceae bacterium]
MPTRFNLSGRWFLYVIAFVVILFIIIAGGAGLIVSYQWLSSLGYGKIFFVKFFAELELGIPAFLILFLLLYFYFNKIKRDYIRYTGDVLSPRETKRLTTFVLWGSALISVVMALEFASTMWQSFLNFYHSVNFGEKDPIFNKDLSLYLFKLPFLNGLYDFILFLIVVLAVLTAIMYVLMYYSNATRFFRYSEESHAFRSIPNREIIMIAINQVAILGLVFFVLLSFGYYLKGFNLLNSPLGVVYGAGYTDINVTLLFNRILIVVCLAAGIMFAVGGLRRNIRLTAAGPLLVVAVVIVSYIASAAVQNFIVSPNEFSRERPYIKNNIEFTQMAYGLGDIERVNFGEVQDIRNIDMEKNKNTIDNIRINDYRPIIQVYNQLQGIRMYYRFNDVDIDRYVIDGNPTEVFLSARELDKNRLSDQARSWINMHLVYTHGYGAVGTPVNKVTPEGQPEFMVRDIPPKGGIKIDRPEIYFGELTNDYVIVNTNAKEFDYPASSGEENIYTVYQGESGTKLGLFNRILYTIYTGDVRLLLSGDIGPDSRILINRNIMDRVQRIAPFLMYDEDPYLVVDDGKLYWMIDAYTVSSNFPYSTMSTIGGLQFNYIRNSVKVVIDAYNGSTDFYIYNTNDPVIKVYQGIFPSLFKSFEEMPEGLREHVRYPQTLFDIQSDVYRTYHMDNEQVFYNKEDLWEIAKERYQEEVQNIESQYVYMALPDNGQDENFILMVPYTPATKNNMISWMSGYVDIETGKPVLRVYEFPKNIHVYGPLEVEARIDEDAHISQQITLWNQSGSSVIRGNTLVIPIDRSILYVEPLYIASSAENSIPEVKRIIVSDGSKIVMSNTIEEALNELIGVKTEVPPPTMPTAPSDVLGQIRDAYNRAVDALKTGDFTEFGRLMDELGNILNQE